MKEEELTHNLRRLTDYPNGVPGWWDYLLQEVINAMLWNEGEYKTFLLLGAGSSWEEIVREFGYAAIKKMRSVCSGNRACINENRYATFDIYYQPGFDYPVKWQSHLIGTVLPDLDYYADVVYVLGRNEMTERDWESVYAVTRKKSEEELFEYEKFKCPSDFRIPVSVLR